MIEEIKVPQMGESVSEATIGSLIKPEGSFVNEGEEIVELETDKVNQPLYAPKSGLLKWKVKEGDHVKIGDVIGSVDTDQKGSSSASIPKKESVHKESKKEEEKPAPLASGEGERLMTSQFIQELKEKPAPSPKKPAPPESSKEKIHAGRESRRKMSKIRQTIGSRLVDALHNAAMLTTFNEVDMSEIMHLRSKYKESFTKKHGVKLGLMSFFVKAVVEALKEFPDFNSYLDKEEIVTRNYYDIGIAVGTEKGLYVPVLRGCDALSFPEIEQEIQRYAEKARMGSLAISDLEGGGFTITNGGVYGSMLSTPILNPPQVGILGMHQILKRPVVVGDAIVIRPMMYLALSYDHRIIDGKGAIGFLVRIKEILEDPSRLLFMTESDGKI